MTESRAGPTEEALTGRATRGDGDAFTRLYDIYVERVYRHISYRVKVVADVEDLTQEVFMRAWRSIRRYKPGKRPFLAWLYTIAHNLVIDYYRKRAREPLVTLEESPQATSGHEDTNIESFIDLDVVRRMLARLPADQQQVLMLRFVEGLDYTDVAAALGKSQGAVRVIQFRALRRLRQR
ncbi:MAG: RNA polymerase sigma factor, partial [Dehalococcoidia bacterium]